MPINADKYMEVDEQSSVDTPSTGKGRYYFKDDGKPYAKNDAGDETALGGGGSGTEFVTEVAQATHGFSVGDVLRWDADNNKYIEAQADTEANAEVIGVVSSVIDTGNFELSYGGYVTLSGQSFTDGTVYFLSADTAGAMTSTEPSTNGQVSKPLFIATGTTTGYFVNWRGNVIQAGVSTPTSVIYQATGSTDITTTSSTYVDMDDMTLEVSGAGDYLIMFTAPFRNAGHGIINYAINVDDTDVAEGYYNGTADSETHNNLSLQWYASLSSGTHTIKIRWKTSTSTAQCYSSTNDADRILTVLKIGQAETTAAMTTFQKATGTTDISTTSTSYIDMTDMSVSIAGAGTYRVNFDASIYIPNSSAAYVYLALEVDGTEVYEQAYGGYSISGENPQGNQSCPIDYVANLTGTGTHTFKIRWKVSAGTAYQNAATNNSDRTLTVTKNSAETTASSTGETVQVVHSRDGAVATGSTSIPEDDTIPQNTEGTEFMTQAITPTNTNNKLKIDVTLCASVGGGESLTVALFQDSTADAIAVAANYGTTVQLQTITFTHYMTAGTTSSTTFKVRAGNGSGNTITFNGESATRRYGGVLASSITITEIQA